MNPVKQAVFKVVAQTSGPIVQSMVMQIGTLNKCVYQKFGKETLPVITKVMSEGGAKSGQSMRKQMGPAKNMKDIVKMFQIEEPMLGFKMEVVEATDKELRFKMSRCPCGIEQTSKELCEAIMASDLNQVKAMLGQEVKMDIIKSVAAGDKECDIIFSVK
jgi:hypothetical protein